MEQELKVEYIEGKGRGVIASRTFKKGTVIEKCPVIAIIRHTEEFSDWELAWGFRKVALVGGLAHLYNHSDKPNAAFVRDLMRGVVTVKTRRCVLKGEELTVRYACKPWFKVAG